MKIWYKQKKIFHRNSLWMALIHVNSINLFFLRYSFKSSIRALYVNPRKLKTLFIITKSKIISQPFAKKTL